jgi:acyl carrier protein
MFDLEESHVLLHSLVGGSIDDSQATMKAFLEESSEYKVLFDFLDEQAQSASELNSHLRESTSTFIESKPVNSDSQIVDELRRRLKEKLPDYMIPVAFILLDTLPLNPNGKVDRNALPLPENLHSKEEEGFVAPQTDVEETIAAILRDVLQIDRVGVNHNFFDLGGNSVHMIQIYNKIREAFEKEFPLVKIFEYPTITSLAAYLNSEQSEESSISRSSTRGEKRKEAAKKKKPRGRSGKN